MRYESEGERDRGASVAGIVALEASRSGLRLTLDVELQERLRNCKCCISPSAARSICETKVLGMSDVRSVPVVSWMSSKTEEKDVEGQRGLCCDERKVSSLTMLLAPEQSGTGVSGVEVREDMWTVGKQVEAAAAR